MTCLRFLIQLRQTAIGIYDFFLSFVWSLHDALLVKQENLWFIGGESLEY